MIKFSELKTEILQSLHNTIQSIKLTDELYNACEKYSKVKELFWKVNKKIVRCCFENYFFRMRIYLFIMLHNLNLVLMRYRIMNSMIIQLSMLFRCSSFG